MLHIVGNGPSRKQYDLNSFEECWGCNGIYRDHTPDILFVHDIPVQHRAVVDGCLDKGKVAVADWSPMPIEDFESIYDMYGMMGANRFDNRTEEDTHFVVQVNKVEPESAKRLISTPLKEKLQAEAEQLNMINRHTRSQSTLAGFFTEKK